MSPWREFEARPADQRRVLGVRGSYPFLKAFLMGSYLFLRPCFKGFLSIFKGLFKGFLSF